jgi:hypothetical protein
LGLLQGSLSAAQCLHLVRQPLIGRGERRCPVGDALLQGLVQPLQRLLGALERG